MQSEIVEKCVKSAMLSVIKEHPMGHWSDDQVKEVARRAISKAALSTDSEPVKTAPAVAVTDGLREAIEKLLDQAEHVCLGAHTPLDIKESAKNLAEPIENLHAALSAQVQDVAGWQAGINEAISVADSEAEMWGHEDGSSARVVAARLRTLLSASPASNHGDAE